LLGEWENGGAAEAVAQARVCPCGCRFRHLHGRYARFVVVGGWDLEISIPRLFCPACGKTAAVLPWFLAPRSPYPWCVRQAAVVCFLAGEGGYRASAAEIGVAWQLVWAWVNALARKAKALLMALARITLRHPELFAGGPLLPTARDLDTLGPRARSPSKRRSLAALGVSLVLAYLLWWAGSDLGLACGSPDPAEVCSFLAWLERTPA